MLERTNMLYICVYIHIYIFVFVTKIMGILWNTGAYPWRLVGEKSSVKGAIYRCGVNIVKVNFGLLTLW